MSMPISVCLTGIGAITPFANGWPDVFQAASVGTAAFAPWDNDLDPPCAGARLGLVKDYPKARYFSERQLRTMDKARAMSVCATGLALEDAGITDACRTDIGDDIASVFASMRGDLAGRQRFGMPLFGSGGAINPAHFPMLAPNVVCGQVAIRFGLRGWSTTVSSGEISGMHALARAIDLVAQGRAPIAVVGAYEVFSKIALHHIKARWRKCDGENWLGDRSNTDVPVEGACVLVIESLESAAKRDAKPYAILGKATHGYLHGNSTSVIGAVGRRYVTQTHESGDGPDVVLSGLSALPESDSSAECALVSSLLESNRTAIELRTRPRFGDGGAQSFMFQIATAAQVLLNQKLEPALLANSAVAQPLGERTFHNAVVTQVTDRGAYGLISMEHA